MTTSEHPTYLPDALEIRSRQVLLGDGQRTTESTVHCPRRNCAVSPRQCEECDACEGIYRSAGAGVVLCAEPAARAAQRHGSKRDSTLRDTAGHASVSTIMTKNVVCVRPDLSLEALTWLMLNQGFSGAPVVDAHGRALGIVSKTDLVRDQFETADVAELTPPAAGDAGLEPGFHAALIARGTVGEVMTRVAQTIPEHMSILDAAAAMSARRVHRLPVVDAFGTVVGIVSSLDIVDWLAREVGSPRVRG